MLIIAWCKLLILLCNHDCLIEIWKVSISLVSAGGTMKSKITIERVTGPDLGDTRLAAGERQFHIWCCLADGLTDDYDLLEKMVGLLSKWNVSPEGYVTVFLCDERQFKADYKAAKKQARG